MSDRVFTDINLTLAQFISRATGIDVGIGSATRTINPHRLLREVESSPMACLGDITKVVLVDTPGLDYGGKLDYRTFEMIAQWLKSTFV